MKLCFEGPTICGWLENGSYLIVSGFKTWKKVLSNS